MTFLATFLAVFLAVSLNKIAEMLFNKYVRDHAQNGLDKLDTVMRDRYGLLPTKEEDKPVL